MKISRVRCLRSFKTFVNKDDSFISGIPCKNTRRCIHQSLNGLQFEKSKTILDKTAKSRTSKFEVKRACNHAVTKPRGLELHQWVQQVKPYWLTVSDIKNLHPFDQIEVVLLDRNISDRVGGKISMGDMNSNELTDPKVALNSSFATYFHLKGLKGILSQQDCPYAPIVNEFEFHIEYASNRWFPLLEGILPARDDQTGKILGSRTHWSKLKGPVHVGYRGPMIRVSDLNKLPKFYFYDEYNEFAP